MQSITCQICSVGFKEFTLPLDLEMVHFSERPDFMTRYFISNRLITPQILSPGICGTDLHIMKGRNKIPILLTLSHEGAKLWRVLEKV